MFMQFEQVSVGNDIKDLPFNVSEQGPTRLDVVMHIKRIHVLTPDDTTENEVFSVEPSNVGSQTISTTVFASVSDIAASSVMEHSEASSNAVETSFTVLGEISSWTEATTKSVLMSPSTVELGYVSPWEEETISAIWPASSTVEPDLVSPVIESTTMSGSDGDSDVYGSDRNTFRGVRTNLSTVACFSSVAVSLCFLAVHVFVFQRVWFN